MPRGEGGRTAGATPAAGKREDRKKPAEAPCPRGWGRGGEELEALRGPAAPVGCTLQDTEVQLKDSGLHGRTMGCHRSRARTKVGPGFGETNTRR